MSGVYGIEAPSPLSLRLYCLPIAWQVCRLSDARQHAAVPIM